MENLNSEENNNEVAETASQKEIKKRISFVHRDHKSMVSFVAAIYKNLGHTEYHSNKAIATVHGISPDSIKQQLTSSQQYKLLELKFGTGYKVTDLFKRIYMPVNDAEERSAVIESLKSPDTYQQLFKEYEFHILPPLSGIKNHFVRNYHLKEDVAEKFAQIFLDNLTDYNLLDNRGVLTSAMPLPPKEEGKDSIEPAKEKKVIEDGKEKVKEPPALTVLPKNTIDIVIPLKSTKNLAHLLLPDDYKEEDLDRIAKFVEALK